MSQTSSLYRKAVVNSTIVSFSFMAIILRTVTTAVFYRLIFANRLRYWNGCVACYAPIPAPCS